MYYIVVSIHEICTCITTALTPISGTSTTLASLHGCRPPQVPTASISQGTLSGQHSQAEYVEATGNLPFTACTDRLVDVSLETQSRDPLIVRSPQSYRTIARQYRSTQLERLGVTHSLDNLTRKGDLEDLVDLWCQRRGTGRDVLELSS